MFLKILVNQARHKWPVTLLLWIAMTALVSLYVYLGNSVRFSNRSMQLIMKNMGHNLLILPKQADPLATYLCSDRQTLFDDDVTARLAEQQRLPSKYYVSVLQKRIAAGSGQALLTGVDPASRTDETREKRNPVTAVPPGQTRLGCEAARLLGASAGGAITVLSRDFRVAEVLDPQGSIDDYRVYVRLADCQELLATPGKINAVLAFLCMQGRDLPQITRRQQEEMAKGFADFRVITRMNIARGRDQARTTTSRYLRYLVGLVLAITVVIIVVTGFQEVSERKREVGILLAMGAGYFYIVCLYLAKLVAIAAAAAVTGFFIGSGLSRRLLAPVLVTNTRPVDIVWSQLPGVIALTCLVALAAEILPMAKLVRMDPNAILVEE